MAPYALMVTIVLLAIAHRPMIAIRPARAVRLQQAVPPPAQIRLKRRADPA